MLCWTEGYSRSSRKDLGLSVKIKGRLRLKPPPTGTRAVCVFLTWVINIVWCSFDSSGCALMGMFAVHRVDQKLNLWIGSVPKTLNQHSQPYVYLYNNIKFTECRNHKPQQPTKQNTKHMKQKPNHCKFN